MIWTDSPSWMTRWNDSNRMAEAIRILKIEFTLAQHPWLENDCLFADIILPPCTKFETDDIGVDALAVEFKTLFLDGKCIEPIGESKSHYEIVYAIAEKLGLLEQFTEGISVEERIRRGFKTSGVQDNLALYRLSSFFASAFQIRPQGSSSLVINFQGLRILAPFYVSEQFRSTGF